MSPSLYIVTTALRGGAGDSSFDDCSPADYPTSVINKIVIKHGSLIDSLQVVPPDFRGVIHLLID